MPNIIDPATDASSPSNPPNNIERLARERLQTSGYPALAKLACTSTLSPAGEVSIRGRVGSYFLKQMAQTLLSQVDGIRQVKNYVEVTCNEQ